MPKETTFENHNHTLSPKNTIQFTSGWGQVNQITLTTYLLETFDLPFPAYEGVWYKIRTVLRNEYLAVFLDGTQVFNISTAKYRVSFRDETNVPLTLTGRFGISAYQDQKAFYRNLVQYDQAGNIVYNNSLVSKDILSEFGVQTNVYAACLDGPKRDRLIWLGDYYHTSRIVGVSITSRFDIQRSTFESLLPTQLEEGVFNVNFPLGYQPNITVFDDVYGLEDYQMLGLLALYYYIRDSNDVAFLNQTWDQFRRATDWVARTVNSTDGLVYLESAFTGPSNGGSSISCLTVRTLRLMAQLASAVRDRPAAERWLNAAEDLTASIRERLLGASLLQTRGIFP